MIQTKFPITVEIDDKSFSVDVSEKMSSTQQEELQAITDKHQSNFEQKDSLRAELLEAQEEFEINKHILSDGKVVDRLKVMFEQKSLNKKIFNLKKDIADSSKDSIGLDKAIEELFEKRFDLSVRGADAAALKKEISELNIGFQTIFQEFSELIKEAKEKK